MRNLAGRLDRLEEGKAGRKASAFYVLWVNPGDDREAALRSSGKIASDAPAYCAEWKVPDEYVRQGRNLGPRARSRLTTHHRISEDEKISFGTRLEMILKCTQLRRAPKSLTSAPGRT
jgi:hypothetical protein